LANDEYGDGVLQDETAVYGNAKVPVRRSQQPPVSASTRRQHCPVYAHTGWHRKTPARILIHLRR